MSQGILYISYDGMLEPLGQSQVLAYLERLAPGRTIHLISFEKRRDWADRVTRAAVAQRIARSGIAWHPMHYHKNPSALATGYDIMAGAARAVAIARKHELGIVHARSYVSGVMALAVKRLTGARLLFDMRGLWADEKVDAGSWSANGKLYRAAKMVERTLLLSADHVVSLTHALAAELATWPYLREHMPPVTVIPTCADLDRFTFHESPQRSPFVLGYVGSVSGRYSLNELLTCLEMLRQDLPDARLLIVNRAEHDLVRRRIAERKLDADSIDLVSADFADMPQLITRMSVGLVIYKPAYSALACSPTKLSEYLGCGVPCLANAHVGDVRALLESHRVGIALGALAGDDLRHALREVVALSREEGIQERCRNVAAEQFSLVQGTMRYEAIYRQLADAPCVAGGRT